MSRPLVIGLAATTATTAFYMRHRRANRLAERIAAAALETLLNAIDANDHITGDHVRRVATYALILARAADLDEPMQRSIERIALFHDIGKIHSALFDIMHEDDKPTAAERRQISTHPRLGAEVLRPLALFYPDLSEGVLSHHERWDGTGYPRGLRGREIPLQARIVTITDTFDAITHRRRYSAGRSLEHAARAIAAGRETQFDPDLADLFVQPPVFAQIRSAFRAAASHRPASGGRRRKHRETRAPDITFRWRSEPTEAAASLEPTRA